MLKFCRLVHLQSINLTLWVSKFGTLESERCVCTEVFIFPPLRESIMGGITARRLSLITAMQIFHREGLEMFVVLWYNGSSKKATSDWSLRLARGGRNYGVWIPTTM